MSKPRIMSFMISHEHLLRDVKTGEQGTTKKQRKAINEKLKFLRVSLLSKLGDLDGNLA